MTFTLWTTDAWLTWTSFCLEGVFSTKQKAIDYAKQENLIEKDCHVVVYQGTVDDYERTAQKVFSTEFDEDKSQLTNS